MLTASSRLDSKFAETKKEILIIRMVHKIASSIGTQQVTAVSSWHDGSQVYGSHPKKAEELREFKDGLMKVVDHNGQTLLPVVNPACLSDCSRCTYNCGKTGFILLELTVLIVVSYVISNYISCLLVS
jgi:hypothetical protein